MKNHLLLRWTFNVAEKLFPKRRIQIANRNTSLSLRRLACILRNPPEDDDVEEISNSTQPTIAAIEAPPIEQTPIASDYNQQRY